MPQQSPIYRDTIGQCDWYHNTYNTATQDHPALKKYRADRYAKTRDTLESAQNRLENKIFVKFKRQIEGSNGLVTLVFRVGKYTFFSVVFPLYFISISVPKWLVTQGMPMVNHMLYRGFASIKNRCAAAAHRMINGLKSLAKTITSPILNFIQTQIDKTAQLFARVNHKLLQIIRSLTAPLRISQKIYGKIQAKLQGAIESLQAFRALIKKAVIDIPKNQWARLYKNFQEKMQALRQKVQRPFEPIAQHATTAIYSFLAQNRQLVENVLDRIVHRPVALIKKTVDRLKKRVQEIVKPVQEKITYSIHSLLQPLRKGREWVDRLSKQMRNKISEIGEKAKEHIHDQKERLSKGAAKVADVLLPTPVVSLFIPFVKMFANRFRKKENKLSILRRWKKKMKEMKEKWKEYFRSFSRQARKSLDRICRLMIQRSQALLVHLAKKLLYGLKKLILMVLNSLTITFLLLRIMFAWMKVFLRIGMILVRDMSRQFLPQNSQNEL